jgi:signal transduction histidine kinase
MLASMPEQTPDPLMRLLRNIDRSTQRLESIVSDLLDLTRLQSGRVQLSLRTIDLTDVASEAVATIRPLADAKQQTISFIAPKRPALVTGDRQRLGQVILNLLSNASKYTPVRGQIVVKLTRQESEIVCSVEDDGPGIALDEQERIFERFYRPENSVTQANIGTGLGLPIAKALVELHEGRIWVRSESGRGSAFYFSVPCPTKPIAETATTRMESTTRIEGTAERDGAKAQANGKPIAKTD